MNPLRETVEIPEPRVARFVFSDARFSWFWLILRIFVGYQWLAAGWEKLNNAAWVGAHAGSAISGFLSGSLKDATGPNPAVAGWYAYFIGHTALLHPLLFSYLISYGEFAVGIGLILGAFTGIAAFFGLFMNVNYLFAGTISINPLLLLLEFFIVLAWRNAGWIGIDRFLLPAIGVPWKKGSFFEKE
jgi:thiosulfate dehydrogenase [quinone] large subunit